MRKTTLKSLRNLVLVVSVVALTAYGMTSCSSAWWNCPDDDECPSDTPWWGGGDYCYSSQSYCEEYYDECWDCS